jgi:hypothetical protein
VGERFASDSITALGPWGVGLVSTPVVLGGVGLLLLWWHLQTAGEGSLLSVSEWERLEALPPIGPGGASSAAGVRFRGSGRCPRSQDLTLDAAHPGGGDHRRKLKLPGIREARFLRLG